MPLILSNLVNDLTSIYETPDSNTGIKASKYANAVTNFINAGLAPGAGSVNVSPSTALLQSACVSSWSRSNPTPVTAANNIASAINTMLASAIVSGGTFGFGNCVPIGPSALASQLISIYSKTNNYTHAIAAQEEAAAIYQFVVAATCFGTGVETPTPVPKIGPIA